ncbi:MAG: cation transporter [Chloroflexi bacterium]|nr:cation transporter [Chloroflexota bacterium]
MFSSRSGAAKLSLIVVVGLIALKVVVAIITGSISIFAQSLDSFLDLFAVLVTFFAITVANRPADEEHPFGHGKVEDIAASVQAVLILAAGGLIIYSAVQRIRTGAVVEMAETGIGVMAVSIVASIFLSRHLRKVARATDSSILEANAHNIAADVYSASGVLAGLLVIRFTQLEILDPVIAIVVAVIVLKTGFGVARKSLNVLIDIRLPKPEEDKIKAAIIEQGCHLENFHDLRTRKAGAQRYIELHLTMPKSISVEESHHVCDRLEQSIRARLPNTSVTIHVEPCSTECPQCAVSGSIKNSKG